MALSTDVTFDQRSHAIQAASAAKPAHMNNPRFVREVRKGQKSPFLMKKEKNCVMMCRVFGRLLIIKHFPGSCGSVSGECSRVANSGTFGHFTQEFQSKWLYKEITTREVLSGFYGTPVYFGTSTFPLHFADLLTWWRLGNLKPTQQQTTQLDPGATGTHRARRGPFPCLAWLETSTAVARRNQVKSDTDDYPALDHLKRAK